MLRAPLNEEPVYDDAGHDGLVGVARLFTEEPANVEEVKDVKDGAVESDVKVGGDGNGLGCSGDKRRICNIFKVCRKELKDTQKAFAEYRLRADYRLHATSVDV
nr:hypothetical protein Iba_chr14dCG3060 [Ipomoea batatas]